MSLDELVADHSEAQTRGSKTAAGAAGQNLAEGLYLQGIRVAECLPMTMDCDVTVTGSIIVASSSLPQLSRRWYEMATRWMVFRHCRAARDSVCAMTWRQRASCFSISGDEEICGSEWTKWSLFSQSVTS